MGINKKKELPNGVSLEYWRITALTHIVNVQTIIELTGYTSQAKRNEEKQMMKSTDNNCDVYIETQFISIPYEPTLTIEDAYKRVKSLDGFDGATDVKEGE